MIGLPYSKQPSNLIGIVDKGKEGDHMIYPKKWIEQRKQFTSEELISKAIEVAKWIEKAQ